MRHRWLTIFLVLVIGGGAHLKCIAGGVPRFAFTANSFNNSISQFIIDGKTGTLIPNGLAPSKQFPSAVAVHPSNRFVFALSQASNELQVYYLDQTTGRLTGVSSSPVQTKVKSPFALSFDASGRYVYIAGRISNNIMGFEFNADTAELTPINGMPVPTQRRARQFVIHPSGKFMYSVNVYSDNVSAFRINENSGALVEIQGSPYSVGNAPLDIRVPMDDIPDGITQAPYNITVHPSGDYVFVTNWMSASVTVFKVNNASGKLTLVEGSPFKSNPHPYDLIVSPEGRYLFSAHWVSNTLVGFEIDTDTGKLHRINADPMTTRGQTPVDLVFHETDNILYVAHYYTHNISSYHYDPKTGVLSLVNSTPTRYGPRSLSMAVTDKPVHIFSNYLYAISVREKSLYAYKINSQNGKPEKVASVPLNAKPVALAYDDVNHLVYVTTNNPDQLQVFSLKNGTEFQPAITAPIEFTEIPGSVAIGRNGLFVYVISPEQDRMIIFERHPETGEIKEWLESPRATEPAPFRLKIDPAGRFIYLLHRKNNVLSAYRGREGLWPLLDNIEMMGPYGAKDGNITAMAVDPLGNYVYAADANHDQVLVYWINGATGILEKANKPIIKVGSKPVDVIVHPGGNWIYVVNQKASNVEVFAIDNVLGNWDKKLQKVKTLRAPHSIKLDAAGRFAYVTYEDSRKISVYAIDATTGELNRIDDFELQGAITDYVMDRFIQ